jgi:hypothetical protein
VQNLFQSPTHGLWISKPPLHKLHGDDSATSTTGHSAPPWHFQVFGGREVVLELGDHVGLYADPPKQAIVIWVDKKCDPRNSSGHKHAKVLPGYHGCGEPIRAATDRRYHVAAGGERSNPVST